MDLTIKPEYVRIGPIPIKDGILTRPLMECLFRETGCVCKCKDFEKGYGKELKVWGPPEKVSYGYKRSMEVIARMGTTLGRKPREEQDRLRQETKDRAKRQREDKKRRTWAKCDTYESRQSFLFCSAVLLLLFFLFP